MKAFALLASLLVLAAACGAGAEPPEPSPPGAPEHALEQAEDGNFTLYVSNQSFERRDVDIRVWIDGFPAVDGRFEVENQHNWVEFRFRLADGPHTLRVESADEEAILERSFELAGKRWAVLNYWCCDEPAGGPQLTFDLSEEPVAFA